MSLDVAKYRGLEDRFEKITQNEEEKMINMKKITEDIVQGSTKWVFKVPEWGEEKNGVNNWRNNG